MLDIHLLKQLIAEEKVVALAQLMNEHQLCLNNNTITGNAQHTAAAIEYWDKRQLVRKIQLNSLYGAILNAGCRFEDKRIGQSTTLTGRQIVRHMASEVNHAITGERNYIGKSIIYGDTDSCYFSAYPTLKRAIVNGEIEWTKESVIELYDNIASIVNATFSSFMTSAFNCPPERGNVIQAGREIVGSKALFIKKKRYAVLVYDKDGKRLDVKDKTGKIKAMGLDLKRADTPVFIQKFLSTILEMVLSDASEREVLEYIKRFRTQFKPMEGWNIGSPKRVNNLAKYRDKEQADGKANLPGHVRASLNWNTLRDIFNDKHIPAITDGSKVIVCKLKPNQYGFTSIAYPIDETHLPDWFLELPFDNDEMESVLIDKKIDNLIGVLQYDLGNTHETPLFDQFFSSE